MQPPLRSQKRGVWQGAWRKLECEVEMQDWQEDHSQGQGLTVKTQVAVLLPYSKLLRRPVDSPQAPRGPRSNQETVRIGPSGV